MLMALRVLCILWISEQFLLAFGVYLINGMVMYSRGGDSFLRGAHWVLQKQVRFFLRALKNSSTYTEWHKKRVLLKNPTKIEEIQEKIYW